MNITDNKGVITWNAKGKRFRTIEVRHVDGKYSRIEFRRKNQYMIPQIAKMILSSFIGVLDLWINGYRFDDRNLSDETAINVLENGLIKLIY